MDITFFNLITPVVHDLSPERSSNFEKINYDRLQLRNTSNNKFLSQDLYGVFLDERGNIFLGLIDNPKTYSFILSLDDDDYHVNYVLHSEAGHLLDWNPETVNGVFKFMDSQPAGVMSGERCDAARKGPSVFLRDGQVPLGGAVNSLRPMSLSDLEVYYSLLSVDGVGHLIYVKYFEGQNDGNEEFETNESDLPTASRSIFPLLKLLIEWESMTLEPWNSTENVAVACKNFFNQLDLPQNVRDEIISNNGPMHVYRYLLGESDARRQPPTESIPAIAALTKSWLKSKMFYPNVLAFYKALTK